ncbi:efflux RND transporter permease subunit [Blastopirellula sp. JC732]|uniref:Efflux RND transporter permease subunit n=1 Tax=Blastopirellula sediminis TaxID=2894196 RepID=A0A9X1SG40_9BACT|nr:efflux RND transporter permease subunit [Blastopirellula sediminis]MCC9609749.1 efflux RND transporter permease subunit [Blastopirellula sediminis]MCC9628993.1 efflux RND transporter permease subunit [Blastopirellula sediminis]
MRDLVRWAIRNTPAMNMIMISVIAVGVLSFVMLRRETFPEFELEIVLVRVPYPGASPEEVESGICEKIEEAVKDTVGIKKMTSVATNDYGAVILELNADVDAQRVLNEIRGDVERIPSFPLLAEDPEVQQITLRESAITVGVLGPESDHPSAEMEWRLRDLAEEVRVELLALPNVSQAEISGAKSYQIDIEIAEATLRRYGLTLKKVSEIVRDENLEMPGGLIRTASQEVLVRGENKRDIGREIAKLPLIKTPDGVVLAVGDLGTVRDDFDDVTSFQRVDGRPTIAISVNRTSKEDLLVITDEVKKFVKEHADVIPEGYSLVTWGDQSEEVRDRLNTLTSNGWQGLILVLVILALFMNTRLAFWVSMGIPISMLGACAILLYFGQTLNMLTMFSFLMALGIVVDDAIVIGENIYAHREMGKSFHRAAVDGTAEVLPSVAMSIATTILAFIPMFFVAGVMGKFMAVMPLAMIAILVISLLEAAFILPCHLAHDDDSEDLVNNLIDFFAYPFRPLGKAFNKVGDWTSARLDWFIEHVYQPGLRFSLGNPVTVVTLAIAILAVSISVVYAGFVPLNLMPSLDSKTIVCNVAFPDGTPAMMADEATKKIEAAIRQVNANHEAEGETVVQLIRRNVGFAQLRQGPGQTTDAFGSHLGAVVVRLTSPGSRTVSSSQIVDEWRDATGPIVGSDSLVFDSQEIGPGGKQIEFKLLTNPDNMARLEAAVEDVKTELAKSAGVYDIEDDSSPGKMELRLRLKDSAKAMNVSERDLAETIRATYYGDEVMRLQRGRHEVKLMVRYPREDRRSLAEFDQIRVRTGDGSERPITELAHVEIVRPLSEINRLDQKRSITVSANVNQRVANSNAIIENLKDEYVPELMKKYPGVTIRWEGQKEQQRESLGSLFIGSAVAMMAMYVLLTIEFNSYFQPLIVMIAIPFGLIGAVGGHLLLGLELTLFSFFGLVALCGVVVNDSIVLVDFINHRLRDGLPLYDALIDTGRRRFRPVLLTSITTIAGLTPLLFETSLQAQVLIPMAVSLCFGLMASTFLVLYLVPVLYLIYACLGGQKLHHDEGDELDDLPPVKREELVPVEVS